MSTGRCGADSGRQIDMHGNRGTGRREEDQETRHDEKVDERRPADENESERNDERDRGNGQPGDARDPPPKHAVPARPCRRGPHNQAATDRGGTG